MDFKTERQRKAVMSKLNPSAGSNVGSDKPSGSYKPPKVHTIPKEYYYPDKKSKPSFHTKLDVKSDIHKITSQDGSLMHGPQAYDEYKQDINKEMDQSFEHDYNKVVHKALKQYKKEQSH